MTQFEIKKEYFLHQSFPLTIDNVLEVEIESIFMTASHSSNFHSEQFHHLTLHCFKDLINFTTSSSTPPSLTNIEKDDTIKILSKLILEIFVQCHSIKLLKSLQFPSAINYILSPFTVLQSMSNLFELDHLENDNIFVLKNNNKNKDEDEENYIGTNDFNYHDNHSNNYSCKSRIISDSSNNNSNNRENDNNESKSYVDNENEEDEI